MALQKYYNGQQRSIWTRGSYAIITISGLDYINNPIIWTRGSGSTILYHLYNNYNLNTYKYSKHINDSIIPNFQIHKMI